MGEKKDDDDDDDVAWIKAFKQEVQLGRKSLANLRECVDSKVDEEYKELEEKKKDEIKCQAYRAAYEYIEGPIYGSGHNWAYNSVMED